MFLLVSQEESAGPISAILFHTYFAKEFLCFFEHVYNSHLIYIFYHSDSCCDGIDLWRIEILKREDACAFRFEEM